MSYVALYRAYRPKNFDEVAGQDVIVQTLRNAIINNKIGHAYIFSGPRGTGKTSLAKIFAKAVNCLEPINGNPCNKCEACLNNHNTDIIEIDGASNNGVDEIRELRDKVKYLPSFGKYKVYIIDEVHMLTQGAFNALLKTLEEPPAHVIFILATTEVHKIPATIMSRCQRYDFKNIDFKNIVKKLEEIINKEKIEIEKPAIEAIATNARGGLRDALSLLDQAISYTNEKITNEDISQITGTVSKENLILLLEKISEKNIKETLKLVDSFLNKGKEEDRIVNDLVLVLRDLLLEKVAYNNNEIFRKLKKNVSLEKIYYYLSVLIESQTNMRYSHQKRTYLEIAVIQMMEHQTITQIDFSSSIQSIKEELEEIKQKGFKSNQKETKKSLVESKDIEEVLHEASKEKKDYFTEILSENKVTNHLEMVFQLVKETEVVAASTESVILTSNNLVLANQLMQEEVKNQVLEIFNYEIQNYYVILEDDWQKTRTIYVELLRSGQKRPKIGPYDFKIYKINLEETKEEEKESVKLAKELFGDQIVEIKE